MTRALDIRINGIVQGVGFRPFVARTARARGIGGYVLNSPDGVVVHAEAADQQSLQQFVMALQEQAPVAAHIVELTTKDAAVEGRDSFSIVASEHDGSRDTLVSPDLATCPDCLGELLDPANRRYHYPFINCTNCGPRFTIIEDLPYDRPVTSMADFDMCDQCFEEYGDELDRRYHAQPNACYDCGPTLWWADATDGAWRNPTKSSAKSKESRALGDSYDSSPIFAGFLTFEQSGRKCYAASNTQESDAIVEHAATRLKEGDVLAVKGLGGWHLVCDATNESAVQKLRDRKHRPTKPLAVMVRDPETAEKLAHVSQSEKELLETPARPIVLCKRKNDEYESTAPGIAGNLPEIGIMLPSTPVQHLLVRAANVPLIMTSGNRSGEPIVATDKDAFEALGAIVDGFLGNNRAIVARYDDSVIRVQDDASAQMIRRARGYAPTPLFTRENNYSGKTIFAAGPEQKSTFAFARKNRIYLSQHLGDLERLGAWRAWDEARLRYERLFDLRPDVVACDMHPEYLASKWAREFSENHEIPLIEVQHHHAHIASVLGENELYEQVIGIALDGTGYGIDGTIWGGEILIADRTGFDRFWHLPAFMLPGGVAAIKAPARTAWSLLSSKQPVFPELAFDNPQFASIAEALPEHELIDQMLEKGINSPICTSAGRLFDAVSALLGICTQPSYDGEAACLLEAQALHELKHERDGLDSAENIPLTALSFHRKLIRTIIEQCERAREETGIEGVALSGGCIANRIVRQGLLDGLCARGFTVFTNRKLPPNDGCIAYGQAIVAQANLSEG